MREIINTPAGARFVDELPAPDDGRGVYLDMLRIAERDLSGDALETRRQEIVAMAKAGGRELPPADPRARGQQMFDQWNPSGKMAATAGADGLPSILSRPQVEFWAQVTKDAPVDPNLPSDLLADVKAWLQTAAASAQGAELLAMAERSLLIAQSLAAYAAAGKAYLERRPK